jgi:hypothetical protein
MVLIWESLRRTLCSTTCAAPHSISRIPAAQSHCPPPPPPSCMYPTVSIFGGASVTANFGATPFCFPPPRTEGSLGCDWVAVEMRARLAPPWLECLQRFKAEEVSPALIQTHSMHLAFTILCRSSARRKRNGKGRKRRAKPSLCQRRLQLPLASLLLRP